jgi:hypothetical protein
VAFVDDEKLSKKRLLSRSARYTGLLDKLDFIQSPVAGALPTGDQLHGVKSWIAVLEGGDLIEGVKSVAALAKDASSVENVFILLTNAYGLDAAASDDAVKALNDPGKEFTFGYDPFGNETIVQPLLHKSLERLGSFRTNPCGVGHF